MAGVRVAKNAQSVMLAGGGLRVSSRTFLSDGIELTPAPASLDFAVLAKGTDSFDEYSRIVLGASYSSFALEVTCDGGADVLAVKAWNSLWIFSLLSLATASVVFPIYSESRGSEQFASSNPNFRFPSDDSQLAKDGQISWAANYHDRFMSLVQNQIF
jgi:hypothetical protein